MTQSPFVEPAASPWLLALALGATVSGCATVESRHIDGTSLFADASVTAAGPGPGQDVVIDGPQCEDSNSSDCGQGATAARDAFFPEGHSAANRRRATSATAPQVGDGIQYFLPRQLAKVTAKKINPGIAKLITALGEAEDAAEAATAKRSGLEARRAELMKAIIDHGGNTPVRDLLLKELERVETALPAAVTAEKVKGSELEVARENLAAAPRDSGASGAHTALTIELLPMSADPAYGFRAKALHSPLRDDNQKLDVTPAGLLVTTNFVATDRTGDILVELAGVAGLVSGNVSGLPRALAQQKAVSECPSSPLPVISIVDFAAPHEVIQLNRDLKCHGVRIERNDTLSDPSPPAMSRDKPTYGLFYRRPVEAIVRIEYCGQEVCDRQDATGWILREVKALPLPQLGPISYVRQDAGMFTKTRYTLGFNDGMLVSYDADRPSEILEVAKLPLKVVDSFFSSASKIVSLRTGQNDEIAKLSASDLALLQSLARDQATTDDFNACAVAKRAAGESIIPCLPEKK